MSRSVTSFAVILLVVAAAVPATVGTVTAADVTLEVSVVDSNGEPVPDANLTATWDGGSTDGETFSNGKTFLDVPEGADVEIAVDHDTYMRNFPKEVSDAEAGQVQIDVARMGSLDVTVTNDEGPVNRATVWLRQNGRYPGNVQTGQDGTVSIGPVEHGEYALVINKPGYLTNTTGITVGNETTKTMVIRKATVRAEFSVRDDHFEEPRPVENATIDIGGIGTTLTTLSGGTATTSVPVNRDLEVTVSKEGYDSVTETLEVGESDTTLDVSIRRTDAISVSPTNQRVVVGEVTPVTVTDEYGDPVEGATVSRDGETVGETDAEGEIDVPIETAGEVTISAESDDLSASATVEGVESGGDGTATGTGPSGTATATETNGDGGPGFGPLVAILALAAAAGFLVRRR